MRHDVIETIRDFVSASKMGERDRVLQENVKGREGIALLRFSRDLIYPKWHTATCSEEACNRTDRR